MKLSARPWKAMPTTIMNATGCMPAMWSAPIMLPAAMANAEMGMMNMPTVIEVRAL